MKAISFNFYKLEVADNDKQIIGKKMQIAKTVYNNVSNSKGYITNNGSFKIKNNFIYGVLSLCQMDGINQKLDVTTGARNPLGLNQTEGILHNAVFLIDFNTNVICLQANNGGIGLSSVLEFIEYNYELSKITSSLLINPSDYEKFNKMTQLTKLEIRVARVKNGTLFTSDEAPFRLIKQEAEESDSQVFDIVYSVGRKKNSSLNVRKIKSMITSLLPFVETKEVKALKITGREDVEELAATVDLIKERLRFRLELDLPRELDDAFTAKIIREAVHEFESRLELLRSLYSLS